MPYTGRDLNEGVAEPTAIETADRMASVKCGLKGSGSCVWIAKAVAISKAVGGDAEYQRLLTAGQRRLRSNQDRFDPE